MSKLNKVSITALNYILNRHKEEDNSFISIEAIDDKKTGKHPKIDKFFNLKENNIKDIIKYIEKINKFPYAAYINVNPLNKSRRKKNNEDGSIDVSKIKFLFIDLDENPTKEEFSKISNIIEKSNLKYSYLGKTGHGYHILIPLNLDIDKEFMIKKFLKYLKKEICNKVDTSVGDLTRIFRVPGSMHYKDDAIKLETKFTEEINIGDIQTNNKKFIDFVSNLKEEKSKVEVSHININKTYADKFFINLLSSENLWKKYINELNNNHKINIETKGVRGGGNNLIFNKNLAIFAQRNREYIPTIKDFFNVWNSETVPFSRFEFFLEQVSKPLDNKKEGEYENKVNLRELLKWANNNDMDYFHKDLIHYMKKQFTKELVGLKFSEFIKQIDKKKYYVKRMFASGTTNMIYSPPASMKSFISYYLALCLTSGRDFLHHKTKKVNVGYFDWENPISDIQNRILGMCKGMNFKEKDLENLFFFTKQPTFLSIDKFDIRVVEELREQLLTYIKENDLKVLFFDTFRRLGNFDENDSKVINAIKTQLFDPLIVETNVCIIFLHHTSKSGENYRGSVDIEGILDTAYSIKKKESQNQITIKNTKRRNNELEKIDIGYDIQNESLVDEDGDMYDKIISVEFFKLVETKEESSDYSQVRNLIISHLEINVNYKNKYIKDLIIENLDKSRSTAIRIINWLVDKEILLKTGEGHKIRYMLHPELKINVESDSEVVDKTSEVIEHWLHEQFKINDLIKMDTLTKNEFGHGKFDEKYLGIVLDKWNKKGWLNHSKKDYLMVTELYRGENK